jgi:hypothetical protein
MDNSGVVVGLTRVPGRAPLHGALNDIIGRKKWWPNLMSSEVVQRGLRKIMKNPSTGEDFVICDFLNMKRMNGHISEKVPH